MARRIKRESSAAPIAEVKKETGPPLTKKPKGKSDGKGEKNRGARYIVDQAGVQLCFSWNFGGGTCGELSPGSPCPAGSVHKCTTCRSDMHSARQCPRWRMFDFSALFFGSGEIRAGRGHFGSRSSERYQGQSHQQRHLRDGTDLLADEPFSSNFTAALNGHFDGFHSGFPCSSFSRARFRPGGPPPVRDRQFLRGRPSNSRAQQLEAEKGALLATRSAAMVRAVQSGGKKRGLCCTATLENPADPGKDPCPSAWLLPASDVFDEPPETLTNLAGTPGKNETDEDVVSPEVTEELNRLKMLGRPYTAPSADELMPRTFVYSQKTNEQLDKRMVAEGRERELGALCSQNALFVIPRTSTMSWHQDAWQVR